jgi:hypothetical protein
MIMSPTGLQFCKFSARMQEDFRKGSMLSKKQLFRLAGCSMGRLR